MGILAKVEDRPTPKEVYNWRVYFSAMVAGSAAIMIGYDSAFIGGTLALPSFTDEFGFEEKSKSEVSLLKANIVSCYQAGAFFGAFFAYPFGHFVRTKLHRLVVRFTNISLVRTQNRSFHLLHHLHDWSWLDAWCER
jgi:Sugar (and other) transporter